jgi:acetyltransferase-like isoleucine patch superfamily enzyme
MKRLKRICQYIFSIFNIFGLSIVRKIEFAIFKVQWAQRNSNNKTSPVKCFPINLVSVGDYSYGPVDVYTYYAFGEGLKIGKYCSIAKDVKFILGGNHDTNCIMTFPIKNKFVDGNINESTTKGNIILQDDVWIGVGATILSGVILGQGCVVAAGSVVTKSFPAYSIIGGNPAKIIKMRFDEEVINELINNELLISEFSPEFILNNIDLFSKNLNINTTNQLLINFNKNRKT